MYINRLIVTVNKLVSFVECQIICPSPTLLAFDIQ